MAKGICGKWFMTDCFHFTNFTFKCVECGLLPVTTSSDTINIISPNENEIIKKNKIIKKK